MHQCMCGVTKLDRVYKEWKNEGGTESGRNRQESSREEAEMVRAYDEKRRPLPRKKGDGNGSTIIIT